MINSMEKTLHDFEGKKKEIRERITESKRPLMKHEIINSKTRALGIAMTAKDRHERRHGNGSRTSKGEALQRIKLMSKDYGIKK